MLDGGLSHQYAHDVPYRTVRAWRSGGAPDRIAAGTVSPGSLPSINRFGTGENVLCRGQNCRRSIEDPMLTKSGNLPPHRSPEHDWEFPPQRFLSESASTPQSLLQVLHRAMSLPLALGEYGMSRRRSGM